MGALTYTTMAYGFLFVFSLVTGNYWLSVFVGILGMFIIIALSAKLDAVDREKIGESWTLKELNKIEHEIEELKGKKPT